MRKRQRITLYHLGKSDSAQCLWLRTSSGRLRVRRSCGCGSFCAALRRRIKTTTSFRNTVEGCEKGGIILHATVQWRGELCPYVARRSEMG